MVSTLPINSFGKVLRQEEIKCLMDSSSGQFGCVDSLSNCVTQTFVVMCQGQEVKVHAIQTGAVAVKRSHLSRRTAHFLTPLKITLDKHLTHFMPIWVWVIEHPEGVLVIDTGENASVMNPDYFDPAGKLVSNYSRRNFKFNVKKENEVGAQLSQLGIENQDIKNVVLTHLHVDHTDGIKDFPDVEFLLHRDEFKYPTGHFPELVPDWFNPKLIAYKDDVVDVFQQAYPITEAEDVLLVPTNGHTRHHASVLFKTDDFDVLFAGDVCYNQKQLIHGDLPGINVNYKKSRKTYENIKMYAKSHNLIFLPSHDIDSAFRLREKQFLY